MKATKINIGEYAGEYKGSKFNIKNDPAYGKNWWYITVQDDECIMPTHTLKEAKEAIKENIDYDLVNKL